jgi:hypothetical protein
LERTPDLIAKVRAMREAAEKKMNRFTQMADYDVRRVVGQGPKAMPVFGETAPPAPASERPKKPAAKSQTSQACIEFAPVPAERADDGESA